MQDITPVPSQVSPANKKRHSSGKVGNLISMFEVQAVKEEVKPVQPPTNQKKQTPQTTAPTQTSVPPLTRTRSLTNGSLSSNIRVPASVAPTTPRVQPIIESDPIKGSVVDIKKKFEQHPNALLAPTPRKKENETVNVNTMVVSTNVSQGVKQRLAKLMKMSKNLESTPTTEEPVTFPTIDKKEEPNENSSDLSSPPISSPRAYQKEHDAEHFYQVLHAVLPFPPPALQAALGVVDESDNEPLSSTSRMSSYHSVNIPTKDLLQAYKLKSIVFHRRFKNFAFHNPFPTSPHNSFSSSQTSQVPTPASVHDVTEETVIPALPESLFGSKSVDFVTWQQQMKNKLVKV